MSSIFLVGADNRLTELRRSDYDSEDLFQRLLADHPALLRLAGGQDGKLLLIRREQPVPDAAGNDRWSLDHLFLDRQGVPVLVEVKQASDTRARREVVAQLLDYAANGVAYWPMERIVQAQRATAESVGQAPDAQLAAFLDGGEAEAFWRAVEANLRSGRIRMLFVADRIPKELARIVEFLNEQMRPAEVLAIEVEQFTSVNGMRTLVPRLLGQTERAQFVKAVAGKPMETLDEGEWMTALESKHGAAARQGAEQAVGWFRNGGFEVGVSDSQDSIWCAIALNKKRSWPFFLRRSTGRLETSLGNLSYSPAYREADAREALLEKLRAIAAPSFRASDKLNGYPAFALEDVLRGDVWTAFTDLAAEIRSNVVASSR